MAPPKHPAIPALTEHVQSSVVIQDNIVPKLLSERKPSVDDLAENKSSDLTTVHTGNLEAIPTPADQDNLATHSVITPPASAASEAKSERCQLRCHDIALNIQFYYPSSSLLATSKPHYFKVVAPTSSRSFQLISVISFTEALIIIRFGDPGALYYDSVVAGFSQRCNCDSRSRSGFLLNERWSYYVDMLLFIHGYNHLQNMEKDRRSKDAQRYIAITQAFRFLYAPRILGAFWKTNHRRATSLNMLIGGGGTAHSYGRILERFRHWHYGEVGLKALPGPASTPFRSTGSEIEEPMQESQLSRPDEGQNDGEVVPEPGLEPQSISSEGGEQMQESQPSPPDEGDHDGGVAPKKSLRSRLAAAFTDFPPRIVNAIVAQNIGVKSDVMKYSQSSGSRTTIIQAFAPVKEAKQRRVRQIEEKVRACTGRPRRVKELRFQAEQDRIRLDRVDNMMQTLRAFEKPVSSRLEQDGLLKNLLSSSTPLSRLDRPFRTSEKSHRHRITSWESLPAVAKVDFDQGNLFKPHKLKTLSKTLGLDQRAFVWSQVIRQLGAEVALRTRTGPQSAAQYYSQSLKRIRAWVEYMKSQQNFPHDLLVPEKLLKLPNRFTGKVYANKDEKLNAVGLLRSFQRATINVILRKIASLSDVGKWESKEVNSRQLSQDLITAMSKVKVVRKWMKKARSTSDNRTTDPQLASIDTSLPYEILHYVFEDALFQLKLAMFYLGRREFPQVMADNKWHSPENVSVMDFILILRQDPDVKRRLDFCADEVRYVKDMYESHGRQTLTSHSDI